MKKYFTTTTGLFRLIAFLEGTSLIALVFIGMPLKYMCANPTLVKLIGPIHGMLFLLFIAGALSVAAKQQWKFFQITWKVLLSSFIPFGTFYIDYTLLRKITED